MIEEKNYNPRLYYRLVALWVVCEAFAGGLMHAAKMPFTGMIVSSLAVSCIMLIAYHIPARNAIMQATLTVAFFKLTLSPHSPPTAYIAVFFQGYLGYLLFNHRKHFLFSSILLAALALVESSLQRILVLLIIYGNSFWEAVDVYIQKTVGGNFNDYSAMLAVIYILIHLLTGILVGTFVARAILRAENKIDRESYLIKSVDEKVGVHEISKRRGEKSFKTLYFVLWLLLVGFYAQAMFDPENAVLPANKIVMILVRSVLVILTWLLILSPLSMMFLKHFIKKQRQSGYLPVEEIQEIIPGIKKIFYASWKISGVHTGITRIKFFFRILLINIVQEK